MFLIKLHGRAVLSGALVWSCISVTFAGLEYVSFLEGSMDTTALIVAIFVVPFAAWGASFYYKKDRKFHGFLVGLIMALTALLLDALITVPLIEMPKGNSYYGFYSYPLLWLLVAINIITVYAYWRIVVRRANKFA